MLESEKLIQIVQAWLSYIRLEELTQAEVKRGSERFPNVFSDNVRLVGNKLLLSNELFKQLQQQQQAVINREKPNEFQIAAALPQIYLVQGRGREQKLKYLPLFTIDISKIWRGRYRKTGWDLTEFEFQPVIVNLMRLYGLEEEVAESLIVTEGMFKFLEDTFKRKFSSLHDFIDQVDLPEGKYKSFRQPYLLRCDFAPYNFQLKQDLREIFKQLQDTLDDCKWLVDNHPAVEYICNSPKPPKQIEPIINLCDDTIKQYLKTAFLERGMTNEDYYRYAPTAKYTATAYHRAAGANGTEGDLGAGIVLRNHYRCAAPIIQFCSPNYRTHLVSLPSPV